MPTRRRPNPLSQLRQLDLFPPEPSRRVALVACSATKAPARAPAERLYRGHLFRLAVEWIAQRQDAYPRWAILSAEHGLVMPGQELEPYDRPMATVDRRAWGARVAAQLRAQFGEHAIYTVLAGADYTVPLTEHVAVEAVFDGWARAHRSAHPRGRWGLGHIKRRLMQELAGLREHVETETSPATAAPSSPPVATATPSVRVVARREIVYQHGYNGFAYVQITRLCRRGVDAYVREARRASSAEHFALSSNARLGHKLDRNRIGREVLELAAPADTWDEIARVVAELDTCRRPVVRHHAWTPKTAPRDWERAERMAG